MAFDKWTLIYSALLLVCSVGNIAAQSCGDTYTKNEGSFTSPNYPDVYDINSTCTYTISLTDISSITLNFETFELDRSPQDYVLINCGGSSDAPYVYFWNSNIPPISITLCISGQLYFYSDPYRNYTTRGFKVHYQVSTKECGNTVFTSSSGTISSPNYPQSYNNDEDCTYSIWAPETSSFTLTFQAFNLQSNCEDFIQIKCDDSTYILPKYCGSTLPKPTYIHNCNRVLIWFKTDYSGVYSGFSLQYSVTPNGCGKLNYAGLGLSGIITSPNYPNAYSNMSCNYNLYPVSAVSLAFQSFDLEPFIDTKMGDYVQIECTSNPDYDDYYFYGNSLPSLITYPLCGCIRLHFFSNNAVSGAGFNVKYQVYPSVAHSAITYPAPKSITVNVGSRVDLYCRSNATGNGYTNYPSWTLSTDGKDENTTVIVSFCVINPGYTSQYSVYKVQTGNCDLVITNATMAQAGIYTCIDVGLASSSSVVTVVEPTYEETDPNVTVIVLSVLLATCVLGYIGIAIFCIASRRRKTSREDEGQRDTNLDMGPTNDSVDTQATGSVREDLPVRVLSPKSSTARTQNDEYGSEHLNHGYDKPPAYDL